MAIVKTLAVSVVAKTQKFKAGLKSARKDLTKFAKGMGDLAVKTNEASMAKVHYQMALEIDPVHDSTRRKLEGLQKR